MTEQTEETSVTPSDQPLEERVNNRSRRPSSPAFQKFMASSWGPRATHDGQPLPVAAYLPARHNKAAQKFEGERLVVPAGTLKARAADTDHRFRAHSSFVYLTGVRGEEEPDAVFVLEPTGDAGSDVTHEAVLYFTPRASRTSKEFYADARHGEFWVGARPSLEELAAETGLRTADIAGLEKALSEGAASTPIRVVRDADPSVTRMVDRIREDAATSLDSTVADRNFRQDDAALSEHLATIRMLKDAYEIAEVEEATAAAKDGLEQMIAALPDAVGHPRGERVLEGQFLAASRLHGNGVSFEPIVAAGNHANTLHWTDNSGPVEDGDLVLIDCGIEMDSLYTADITRTLPANGKFTGPQKKVYEAVLDANLAAYEKAKEPGVRFSDIHDAAMGVLARRLSDWGVLPVSVEESLSEAGQQHRRWMPHGTAHHLGLDVHDCAEAPQSEYQDALLAPGMLFTIEPGLYFRADDLAVPEELRGIGVRIEDNIFVDEDGSAIRVSENIPRTVDEVERWMEEVQG